MSQVNQISAVVSAAAQAEILAAINVIKSKLPFLVNLSNEDRKSLPKMGDKTVAFVNKAVEYAGQNPKIAPNFLDVPELEKDVTLVNSLSTIFRQLGPLAESIDDTMMLAGSEAYAGALSFYSASKSASKQNVPGANAIYDDLAARFPGRPKATGTGQPPVTP